MSHRNDYHRERMVEHLQERQWTQEDIEHFAHMVGHSALLSPESAMFVLEFQQATDERIAAEAEHDRLFADLPVIERTDEAQLRRTADAGWDSEGRYMDNTGHPLYEPFVGEQQ